MPCLLAQSRRVEHGANGQLTWNRLWCDGSSEGPSAANGGLPVHIGAALLGHMNLQTTQDYVAVFAEDVVGHYQKFLDHRRSQRPEDEYTDVTRKERAEFEEHFDKRKVELGNCARPYGTPCQHEHACLRCPMLQINPKMLPRLDELEKDLVTRRKRAEEEQRLGEIEGIDLTLTFLRTKQADAIRSRRRTHCGSRASAPSPLRGCPDAVARSGHEIRL